MSVRGRRRRGSASGGGGHGGGGGERWLVSYADFITLMFVVFTVLFSMARLDADRYSSLARSLQESLGPAGPDITSIPTRGQPGRAMPVVPPTRPGNVPDVPDWPSHLVSPPSPELETVRAPIPPTEPPPEEAEPSEAETDPVTAPPAADEPAPQPEPEPEPAPEPQPEPAPAPVTASTPPDPLEGLLKAFKDLPGAGSGLLAVALEERGLVVSIAGSVLFKPGETTLQPEAKAQLDAVAKQLVHVALPILVEGTTDPTPARGPDALSPWDLSALRAGAVVRYLVEEKGLPDTRFVTIGYIPSDDEAAAEHRVRIIVLRKAE